MLKAGVIDPQGRWFGGVLRGTDQKGDEGVTKSLESIYGPVLRWWIWEESAA